MTDAAKPIVSVDAEDDDPDTGLIEALRDSEKPARVLRAHQLACRKLDHATERLRRRSESPPAGIKAAKR